MLAPERLKSYLLDEDSTVRQAVTEYFSDGRFQDPTVIPSVLDACDRYGLEANGLALAYARHLPVSEQALDGVLEALRGPCPPTAPIHLNRLVANAPVELFTAREQEIRSHKRVERWAIECLERRRTVANSPAAKLWDELQAFAERSESKQHVGEIDHAYTTAPCSNQSFCQR